MPRANRHFLLVTSGTSLHLCSSQFQSFQWFDQLTMSGISTTWLRSNRLDNELAITKSSRQVAWSAARRYDGLITSVAAVFLRSWQSPLCSFCPRRYESSHFSAGLSDPES